MNGGAINVLSMLRPLYGGMQTTDPGPEITDRIIRCGLKVHRAFGPGLLEKVYQQCLGWELREA